MAAVKGAGVGDIEVAHKFAQVAERGFHQEMEMVAHKNIDVKLGFAVCKFKNRLETAASLDLRR